MTVLLGIWFILFVISLALPALGLALFALLVPLLEYLLQGPSHYSVVTVAGAGVALGCWIRLGLEGELRRWSPWIFGGFLLLLLSAAVRFVDLLYDYPSLFWRNLFSADQLNPFVFVGESVLWLTAALLAAAVIREGASPALRRLMFFGVLGQGPILLTLLLWDSFANGWNPIIFLVQHSQGNQPNLFVIFDEHNTFAAFWMVHLLLLASSLRSASGWRIVTGGALAFLYLVMIFLSVSLTTVLALLLSVIVLLGLYLWRNRQGLGSLSLGRSVLVLVLGLIFLASLISSLYLAVPEAQRARRIEARLAELSPDRLLRTVYERRVFPWKVALEMIEDYPLLGVGPGRFFLEYSFYRERFDYGEAGWFFERAEHENAHNYYLQLGAELGLAGLLLLLTGLWALFRSARFDAVVRRSALAGVVGLACLSLLQHPLLVEALFLSAALLVGLAASGERAPRTNLKSGRRALLLVGTALVLLFVHGLQAWNAMPPRFTYGLYQVEDGESGSFRWTGPLALLRGAAPIQDDTLALKAYNPDLRRNPLPVLFEIEGEPVDRLLIAEGGWVEAEIQVEENAVLAIRPGRTFQPPGDRRQLGVALRWSDSEDSR